MPLLLLVLKVAFGPMMSLILRPAMSPWSMPQPPPRVKNPHEYLNSG